MITYNRLEYTKRAFASLLASDASIIFLIDNGSTDGTLEWMNELNQINDERIVIGFRRTGVNSIANAMNTFLDLTATSPIVGKVDNDTLVPPDFFARMIPHLEHADMVQAKHPILKATHPDGFLAWVSGMARRGALRYNHFIGGSGIVFKHPGKDAIPETPWIIGGWREYQRRHPQLKKAFATDVSIELLDTDEVGADYSKYPDYYRQTKRL